ncbi:MAG: TraI domain-containing protein [Methylomicrobium sp.]|nr:TraI domain-containing protein [Methylomicrobium sp.]
MIKKIAALFKTTNAQKSKLNLDKKPIEKHRETKWDVFDEYAQRLPGFPLGIPVIPVEHLIEKNRDMIKQIILARGLAGEHNKDEVEKKVMSPIRHLAEMTHLLPASEKNHFKLIGGLFAFCLEVSLFSIRYAERRILTRSTPEIRKEEESLWAHAAFLNGLFCEAITALSKISVYAEGLGIEWRPGGELLYEWLINNELARYHIRWNETEDRSTIYIMMGKAIQKEQADILAAGEKAIYKTLYSALQDKKDKSNPLARIFAAVTYKIMERDEWSHADRYGKPLPGMHLEPWLIDAMRHLVQKKRWTPNDENGRVWHGKDGVFLVWPLAATDMQHELRANECPFIPNTNEVLADILLEAGIVSRNHLGGYVYEISVPVIDSKDRKCLDSLKIARPEILFVKTHHQPINEELCTDAHQENELDEDKNEKEIKEELEWQEVKNELEDLKKHNQKGTGNRESRIARKDNERNASTESNGEESGKHPLVEQDNQLKKQSQALSQGKKKDELGSNATAEASSEELIANNYDDDYAADYESPEGRDYNVAGDEILVDEDKVSIKNNAVTVTQPDNHHKKGNQKQAGKADWAQANKPFLNEDCGEITSDKGVESLIDLLIAQSKNEPEENTNTKKKKQSHSLQNSPSEISHLTGNDPQSKTKKTGRVDLVLKKLKSLPEEHLSVLPGGITKVMAKGLKETGLELNDCISVLKSAGLIKLIDGNITGLTKTGKGTSRYFLIKANLFDGK